MLLVYTPMGNITVVSQYLQQKGLLLDHPTLPTDQQRLQSCHYANPHNPPPGGHRPNGLLPGQGLGFPPGGSRWTQPAVAGKSVEVQRSQMDDLFKSLRSGEELQETAPGTPFKLFFIHYAFDCSTQLRKSLPPCTHIRRRP